MGAWLGWHADWVGSGLQYTLLDYELSRKQWRQEANSTRALTGYAFMAAAALGGIGIVLFAFQMGRTKAP
jgi:hypothetical protein